MVSRACGAVSCEPLADFGNSVIARLEHHSGRPPYDAASRRGHGLPALLRRGSERAAPRLRDYLLRRGYPPPQVMRTVAALTGARPDGADETQ